MQKRAALAPRDANKVVKSSAYQAGAPKKAGAPKAPAPRPPVAAIVAAGAGAGCLFFDPTAVERQKQALVDWVNFVLGAESAPAQITVCSDLAHGAWEAQRAEARTHAAFARLLHSAQLRPQLARLDASADNGVLRVRDALHLGADVGLRDNVISLLGCFSPAWLRPAAQAIARERIAASPTEGASPADEAAVVRRFLEKRVFAPPAVELRSSEGLHPAEAGRQ